MGNRALRGAKGQRKRQRPSKGAFLGIFFLIFRIFSAGKPTPNEYNDFRYQQIFFHRQLRCGTYILCIASGTIICPSFPHFISSTFIYYGCHGQTYAKCQVVILTSCNFNSTIVHRRHIRVPGTHGLLCNSFGYFSSHTLFLFPARDNLQFSFKLSPEHADHQSCKIQ